MTGQPNKHASYTPTWAVIVDLQHAVRRQESRRILKLLVSEHVDLGLLVVAFLGNKAVVHLKNIRILPQGRVSWDNSLVGLLVKASVSRAEDPEFESRLRRDFFGVESYHWLKKMALQWLPCQASGVIGSTRYFLQSPHCAANCLQHVRSSGPGTIVCKSRATH